MTPMEAWSIISSSLRELYDKRNAGGEKPYNDDEIEAELLCFMALREMQRDTEE